MASEQGSGAEQVARREPSDEGQSRRPGTRWCIRHREKTKDNRRTPPEMIIQCRGARRAGGTGGTRRGRHKTRREGNEAPAEKQPRGPGGRTPTSCA